MTTRTLSYQTDKQGGVYLISGSITIPCPADDTWDTFVEFYGKAVIMQYAENSFDIEAQRLARNYRKQENPLSAIETAAAMVNWKPKLKTIVVRESAEVKAQKAELAASLQIAKDAGIDVAEIIAQIRAAKAAQAGA